MQLSSATILAPCHPHEYRDEVICESTRDTEQVSVMPDERGRGRGDETYLTQSECGSKGGEVRREERGQRVREENDELATEETQA